MKVGYLVQANQKHSNNEWQVNLEVFEGPLDLLLHLINELEIDIYDIPISQITSQYLAYLNSSNLFELDSGGQYIVMAATLISIKSQMLVPRNDEFDEVDGYDYDTEDPRDHLMSLLIEYRRFKNLASELAGLEEERSGFISKPHDDISHFQNTVPLKEGDIKLSDLQLAFNRVINEQASREPIPTRIQRKEVSISDKMTEIMNYFEEHAKSISFSLLFENQPRYELVTSFLALLELIKSNDILVSQADIFDEIIITKAK